MHVPSVSEIYLCSGLCIINPGENYALTNIPFVEMADLNAKMTWYMYLLEELPSIQYSTLKKVIGHLAG